MYWLYKRKKINTRKDDAHDIDIVMPMYNLIEYSDAYSMTSGSIWQCFRDKPAPDKNTTLLIFLLITIIVLCSYLNSK